MGGNKLTGMASIRKNQFGAKARNYSSRDEKRRQAILKQVNGLAWLLDNSIRLPFINYRIGVDAVIGVVPGLGDVVGLLLSSYIVTQAMRLGVPRITLLRMIGNLAIETVLGMVPLLGDIFDATYKANARNVKLLNEVIEQEAHRRSTHVMANRGATTAVIGALVGVIALAWSLGMTLFSWVASLLDSPDDEPEPEPEESSRPRKRFLWG